MRQSDMKKSADDILKIIEESFQILLGKKGGNSNNERILTERFVDGEVINSRGNYEGFLWKIHQCLSQNFADVYYIWVNDRKPNSPKCAASINKISIEETRTETQSKDILGMIQKQHELHRKQQKQIDLLTQMVPRQQFHSRGRDIHPGRGRRLRQS